jgi:NAD(P)-dependent dehydrogenase (short-subunit alcohol dehydrogenase family)
MTGRLAGKVAVVTGAGKGIGRATAIALAKESAQIVITARTQADLEALAAEIGTLDSKARTLVVAADVSQEGDVNRLAQTAFETFGRVDILVNNAGVGKNGTVGTLTTADYDWIMNTNMVMYQGVHATHDRSPGGVDHFCQFSGGTSRAAQ